MELHIQLEIKWLSIEVNGYLYSILYTLCEFFLNAQSPLVLLLFRFLLIAGEPIVGLFFVVSKDLMFYTSTLSSMYH